MHRAGSRRPTRSRPRTTCSSPTAARPRSSAASRRAARVGVTVDLEMAYPATDDPEDVAACREFDGERNRWFLDPLFRGAYPDDVLERARADRTAGPGRRHGGDRSADRLPRRQLLPATRDRPGGGRRLATPCTRTARLHTDMGWEVSPNGLFDLMRRLHDEYAPRAIIVTENGAAFADARGHDGSVRDPKRRDYIAAHVEALGRAIAAGVPVEGYYAGRSSTTSSGRTATRGASASSTSTMRRSSACRSRASTGTAITSPV